MIFGAQENWDFCVMDDVTANASKHCTPEEPSTPTAHNDYGGFLLLSYFTNLLSWFALLHLESDFKLREGKTRTISKLNARHILCCDRWTCY